MITTAWGSTLLVTSVLVFENSPGSELLKKPYDENPAKRLLYMHCLLWSMDKMMVNEIPYKCEYMLTFRTITKN